MRFQTIFVMDEIDGTSNIHGRDKKMHKILFEKRRDLHTDVKITVKWIFMKYHGMV
jgi:hypothetical protein